MTNSTTVTYKEILKHFTNYLAVKWNFFGLGRPTELQYEIAEWYQHGPSRKQIQGFRGIAKSYIVCSYCEWMWLNDRNYRIVVLSGNGQKANEISTFIKRCIEDFPLLRGICPPNINKAIWGNERFFIHGADPMMAPSLKSVGIFGNFTGSRANEIVADDIEIPANSATPDMRDKLFKRSTEMESVIIPEKGKITLLGTPQTEETIYRRYEERGYTVRRWPARVPLAKDMYTYGDTLSPIIQKMSDEGRHNEPTEPKRFDEFTLMQREVGMGSSEFRLQFMLDTSLSDADRYPLKLKDLIVMHLLPDKAPLSVAWSSCRDTTIKELPNVGFSGDRFNRPLFVDETWVPYEHSLMFIDPSGRGKDETGWVVLKQSKGRLFLCGFGGVKGGYSEEALEQLAMKAKGHSVNLVLVEDNFGDGMFRQLFVPVLNRHHKCRVEGTRVTGQKEKRIIATVEPVMNQHRLVVDMGHVVEDLKRVTASNKEGDCWYSLMYQLSRITKDRGALKHDDILDALSGAIEYYNSSMQRDVNSEKSRFLERQKAQEFDRWLKGSFQFPRKQTYDTDLKRHKRGNRRALKFYDP